MRRLAGIHVVDGVYPVALNEFLEVGDITVLAGPNDSGKTRMLRAIEAVLNGSGREETSLELFVIAKPVTAVSGSDRPEYSPSNR
jgi:hypothetical protein